MIDLHTHTTASDGYLDADTLVREAWSAGIRTLAVTDHDTVAAITSSRHAATAYGLTLITGIEITAKQKLSTTGLNQDGAPWCATTNVQNPTSQVRMP